MWHVDTTEEGNKAGYGDRKSVLIQTATATERVSATPSHL